MSYQPEVQRTATGHHLDRLLIAALAVSVLFNVLFGTDVYRARRKAAEAALLSAGLKAGAVVKPFSAERLDGGAETIDFSQRTRTILYFSSSSCVWCERNLANLKALDSGLTPDDRLVIIALDKDEAVMRRYAAHLNVHAPIYYRPDPTSLRSYLVTGTPTTIVVSSSGKVVETISGAYSSDRADAVEQMFKVALPGVSVPSS